MKEKLEMVKETLVEEMEAMEAIGVIKGFIGATAAIIITTKKMK